ncbi:MAG: hypothetical protein V4719_25655 [Planctomycetota bacterium]
MVRLEALFPDLVDKLRCASDTKQRKAGLAASEFAISHVAFEHTLVKRILEKVRATGILTPKEKAEIDGLAEKFDDEYFAMQDAAEKEQSSSDDYMRSFGKARAVAALSFAGNENAFEAATEAIYEAAATTIDQEELFALIQSVLE